MGEQLGKPLGSGSDYAESWEIVDHWADQSIVAGGPLAGQSLNSLITVYGERLLGDRLHGGGFTGDSFPLLLKYLDCNRVLSVQVHPGDAYAQSMPTPDLGKTEAWYIVASAPDSQIYAGLKTGVDRARLERAVAEGEMERVLHSFHPEAGDAVFIPAGTIHALGSGLLVAEIQQSSNTTFRLFDWNRRDANGQQRELHLRESLEVVDYDSGPVHPLRADATIDGWQGLVECDKFVLRAILRGGDGAGGDGKFHILTVPHGRAILRVDHDETLLRTGESLLLPACISRCEIEVDESSVVLGACLPD